MNPTLLHKLQGAAAREFAPPAARASAPAAKPAAPRPSATSRPITTFG